MTVKNQNPTQKRLDRLLRQNRDWADSIKQNDPNFFSRLSQLQTPEYLWIGCSDSRVPANQITGLTPGEVFVHRNVGNVVVHADLNCLSVLQYSVDVLKIKHIIVCGHYGCGGISASLDNLKLGLVDNWLRHVQDIAQKHKVLLQQKGPRQERLNTLCELNVIEQVVNVAQTTVVQDAWNRQQELTVHGWIYGINDGLVRDLAISISHATETQDRYSQAVDILHG